MGLRRSIFSLLSRWSVIVPRRRVSVITACHRNCVVVLRRWLSIIDFQEQETTPANARVTSAGEVRITATGDIRVTA